jgi:hypothetical protein
MNLYRLISDSIIGISLMIAILLSSTLLSVEPSFAQVPVDNQEEIEVMILGTSHFGNPGQDVINFQFPDVLEPEYQAQIEQVTENLSRFQPTKIALEARPDYKPALDSMYAAYKNGTHSLTRNERQQLGFRLAKQFEHPHVYSIDHGGEFPFQAVLEFAEQHQPGFIEKFQEIREYVETTRNELIQNSTISEILHENNSTEELTLQRHFYALTAAVGNDTTFVGADLVSRWHERNIKIFSSLSQIAEPGDRIIVIFGSGHAPLLRYFVKSDLQMKLIEPNDYL